MNTSCMESARGAEGAKTGAQRLCVTAASVAVALEETSEYVVLRANYGPRRRESVIKEITPFVPKDKKLVRADKRIPAREWLPAYVLE